MRYLFILIYMFFFNILAHEYEKNDVKVIHPVLKLVSSEGKVGAGYFTIINNGKNSVKLLGIVSNIAKRQEIHEVILDNNIYKMRPIKEGLVIKPGQELIFKSKSYHVMFFDIKKHFKSEDMVDADIMFSNNFIINVKFKVLVKEESTHNH